MLGIVCYPYHTSIKYTGECEHGHFPVTRIGCAVARLTACIPWLWQVSFVWEELRWLPMRNSIEFKILSLKSSCLARYAVLCYHLLCYGYGYYGYGYYGYDRAMRLGLIEPWPYISLLCRVGLLSLLAHIFLE